MGVSPSFLIDFAKCLIKFNVAVNNFFRIFHLSVDYLWSICRLSVDYLWPICRLSVEYEPNLGKAEGCAPGLSADHCVLTTDGCVLTIVAALSVAARCSVLLLLWPLLLLLLTVAGC